MTSPPEGSAESPLWLQRVRFLVNWIASAGVSGFHERWPR